MPRVVNLAVHSSVHASSILDFKLILINTLFRDAVIDGDSNRASDTLLADYSVTPGAALRTPR